MNAACQLLPSDLPNVPLALLWKDPENRFSLEIPSHLLGEWQRLCSAPEGVVAFLTATKRSRPIGGGDGYVLGFEPVAASDSSDFLEKIRVRSENAADANNLIGIAANQSGAAFGLDDRKRLGELMQMVPEPRLFLSVGQSSDGDAANLSFWDAKSESSHPIGVEFSLSWEKLDAQYYSPFTPVFFANSPAAASAITVPAPEPAPLRPVRVVSPRPVEIPIEKPQVTPSLASPIPDSPPVPVEPRPDALRSVRGSLPQTRKVAIGTAFFSGLAVLAVTGYNLLPMRTDRQDGTPAAPPAVVSTGNTANMGLSVQFKGPVMEIGWDRSSPAAKVAQSGRVDIRDGEQKVSVQLDTAQLAAGRVLYSPISSDTRIQLQMTTPDGFVQDMIRVLRVGRSSAAGAEENVSRARTVTTVASSTSSSSAPRMEEPITAAPIAAAPAAATTAPVAGRVFVPPAARRQNTSVEPAVIEPPPQLTFASSALTQPSLPKLEVRAPSPSPSAPIKSVVAPPVPLGNLAVYVPPAARTADIAGREISVKVHVDSQGRIARIEPGQLSPRVVLAVTDAAKRWRFKPATASGKPVPSELIIHLKFPARR